MTQKRFDDIVSTVFIVGSFIGIVYVVYSLMAKG